MTPRIVGGSDYDNPYARSDPFSDTTFEAFDPQNTKGLSVQDDPVAQIKAEFAEAQRRQSAPRPRKGAQT